MIGDYPFSDGWTLTYSFRGPAALADAVCSTSGTGYLATISAANTTNLAAGTYNWAGRVSKAGEVYTVVRGVMTVALVAAATVTSHEEKVLAAITATIEGRVTADMNQYAIGGRQVTKMAPAELLKLKGIYERKVWHLRNPGKIGIPVHVSFTPTEGQYGTPEPCPFLLGIAVEGDPVRDAWLITRRVVREQCAALVAGRAELALSAALLAGWALVTLAISRVARPDVVWTLSGGITLLLLCGVKCLADLFWDGLFQLTRDGTDD